MNSWRTHISGRRSKTNSASGSTCPSHANPHYLGLHLFSDEKSHVAEERVYARRPYRPDGNPPAKHLTPSFHQARSPQSVSAPPHPCRNIDPKQDSSDQQGLLHNPCSSSPQPTKQSVRQLHEITEEPLSRNHGHGTVQSQTPVPPRSHSFATVYNRNKQEAPKIYGKNPSVNSCPGFRILFARYGHSEGIVGCRHF